MSNINDYIALACHINFLNIFNKTKKFPREKRFTPKTRQLLSLWRNRSILFDLTHD